VVFRVLIDNARALKGVGKCTVFLQMIVGMGLNQSWLGDEAPKWSSADFAL